MLSVRAAVLLLCAVVYVHGTCKDGEFEVVDNVCRYKYMGVYSVGRQANNEFGSGGLTKLLKPYVIPRNDSDIVEGYYMGSIRSYVKTKNTLYRLLLLPTTVRVNPIIYVPQNFSIIGGDVVLLSNGTVFNIVNDRLSSFVLQPPVTCIDMVYIVVEGYLCLTSSRVVYIYEAVLNAWRILKDFSTVAKDNSKDLKLIATEGDSRLYGIISNGIVYASGTIFNDTIVEQSFPNDKISFMQVHATFKANVSISADTGIYIWGEFGGKVYTSPTLFLKGVKIVSLTLQGYNTIASSIYAISDKGVAYAFGSNADGQLADGTITNRNEPVVCSIPSQRVYGFGSHIVIYKSRIEVYDPKYDVQTDYQPLATPTLDSRVKKVIAQDGHLFLMTESGNIFGTGQNGGYLGDGTLLDANVPVRFAGSVIQEKKVVQATIGLGVTEDNLVFVWGNVMKLCNTNSNVTEIPTTPQVVASLNTNYTILGTADYSAGIVPRIFFNNMVMECGRTFEIVPGKVVTKMGPFVRHRTNAHWVATSDGDLMILDMDITALVCKLPLQDRNCTVDDHFKQFFSAQEVYRITIYEEVAFQVVIPILFVLEDGRSFLFKDGTYVPFEKMDNRVHIGSPNIFVTENGTILNVYYEETTSIRRLKRSEQFPKILSAAATTYGLVGVYASCSEHFVGLNCDIPVCNGIPANSSEVCNNRKGECIKPKLCSCSSEYRGQYCDICKSPMYEGKDCNIPTAVYYVVVFLTVALAISLLVIITAITFVCLIRYRQSINKIKAKENQVRNMLSVKLIEYDQLKDENIELSEKVDRDWIIPLSELSIEERLSSGSFGTVMRGKYQGLDVAIKVLHDVGMANDEEFKHEVKMLRSLRHPNIVLFMGVALSSDSQYIVTELMPGKSFDKLIYNTKKKTRNEYHNAIPFKRKVELLKDVVVGMLYLHSQKPPIVHRDLKPNNILLDKNHTICKVCDFGTAIALSKNTMTGNIGTVLYMAPEMLTHKVSQDQLFKVDVYSFGIIMYETFFEKLPFQGENNQMDSIVTLGMRVVNNERPFVPDINVSDAEKLYLETMKACWSANPIDRPTFTDVFSQFEEILSMSN